ncbi:hypothetical protein GGS23DRAFT_563509 [Durotheca rogersii]|uniref:uncharacterized protein n=1 Tax=Durotheca rogersii TaxID=419775 RepID=UPI0022204DA3|nr:uncharacterized protein GGS23DRAFT_563509 [Durotheca rogersii]KAI5864251.1 hypothetical protein GGS23DRAFT_563509 [Durotheca rogersii]
MAPRSKSPASSAKTAANANPAPEFTVNMNRIQMRLESRLRTARAFLPSTPEAPGSLGSSRRPFSTFNSNSSASTSSQPRLDPPPRGWRAVSRAAEESEFAEERGLDPNAGIGLIRAARNSASVVQSGRDRETTKLRGRLFGGRGKGLNGDGNSENNQRWVRKEESSDEETGRSGLGRAKMPGKRSRTGIEFEDGERQEDLQPPESDRSAEPSKEIFGAGGVREHIIKGGLKRKRKRKAEGREN